MNRYKYGKVHLLDSYIHKHIKIISLLVVVFSFLGFYCLTTLQLNQLLLFVPLSILTLLYGFSFITIKGVKYSLRYVPTLKIFLISLVWVLSIGLFPLIGKVEVDSTIVWFLIELFLFVIVLTLPFDIRDVTFDDKSLKTIPILFGVTKAKILGVFMLFLALFIHTSMQFMYLKASLITFGLLALLLMLSKPKKSNYYTAFWVEGIPIIWFLLVKFIA
ncbi:hypothetical protein N9901_00240 [Flavobacteriaceae bacterium]|nr:hypothetical protein [Flavobacteriaceae bacterium]